MIRKAIIIFLATLALASLSLGVAANCSDTVSWAMRDADGLPRIWFFCTGDKLTLQHWCAIEEERPWSHTEHAFIGVGVLITFGDVRPSGYTKPDRLPLKIINIFCPRWFPFLLCLLLAIYPMLAFVRRPLRRYRRRKRGWCVYRGYNLKGDTSGVCPECGQPK